MGEANAADWLAAIGTVLTAAVSIGLVGRDVYDRRRRGDAERRQQARLVHVVPPEQRGGSGIQGSHMDLNWRIVVANESDESIDDAYLRLHVVLLEEGVAPLPDVAVSKTLDLGRVPPRSRAERQIAFTIPDIGEGTGVKHRLDAILDFTDSAGVRWRRDPRHVLHEVRRAGRS